MPVLVYARPDDLPEATEAAEEDRPDAAVLGRNAVAHAEGQLEDADLVLVDDRFPAVYEDYEQSGREVELFNLDGRATPDPEPEQDEGEGESTDADVPDEDEVPGLFRDQFASPTAYEEAQEAGLEPPHFDGVEPAGKTGYTTAQVRELAGEQ